MELSNKTARELFAEVQKKPPRNAFGFGTKPALINIDLQNAFTRPERYKTAYATDPNQLQYVNQLAAAFRARNLPVVWTYVAYMESGEDCGVWQMRNNNADSLQNIKHGSERAQFDERLDIDKARDVIMHKRMASPFFETNLWSLLNFHRVDTLVLTGGSTSGCVRTAAVDGLSRGYRCLVPEECVADRHESPHFAGLYDLAVKYADVIKTADVKKYLETQYR